MRTWLALIVVWVSGLVAAERTVVVNDYVGMGYAKEPVSFDVTLEPPCPVGQIGLKERYSQVEIIEGTSVAVTKARVWIDVDFPLVDGKVAPGKDRHLELTLVTGGEVQGPPAKMIIAETTADPIGGVETCILTNLHVRMRLPAESKVFDAPVSALTIPGPVVAIGRGDGDLVGRGYLDCINRIAAVEVTVDNGPIYREHRITYHFADGRRYASRVRLYADKPYALLVEDFDLGGNARYVFNYEGFPADGSFHPHDSGLYGWAPLTENNPCGDFVEIPGQRALARLVVWSQFNYFGGKQETIGLKTADPTSLAGQHATNLARYEKALAKWEGSQEEWRKKPPKKGIPPKPEKPDEPVFQPMTVELAGASLPSSTPMTPGGDGTAVGAFYMRPDRWTRAKLNHVDLYLRPEVPGNPMTRGEVGLHGAVLRPALEAWLVDGHREWAIFAVRAGDAAWLAKAHVQEGVWPLDRLNRLPLVWNSDGTPVDPAATTPGDEPAGGPAQAVLKATGGRSGLQWFNGSNGQLRNRYPQDWDGKVVATQAGPEVNSTLAGLAFDAYLSADDSTYPSRRAMLPWSDPEALNPFYQGMENMNFNADLYRYVTAAGIELARRGHPEADRFIGHGEMSLDLALGCYVYPQSGCWEESHGYAGHTVKTVTPLVKALKALGKKDFFQDPRFARMVGFFTKVYSPLDAEFGVRVVPPIGDHGLSKASPAERLGQLLEPFAAATDPQAMRIIAETAGLVAESGGVVPAGIDAVAPDRASAWLQGYGAVLRGFSRQETAATIVLKEALVRAEGKKDKEKLTSADLILTIGFDGEKLSGAPVAQAPSYNKGTHNLDFKDVGTRTMGRLTATLVGTIGDDKWVKGGEGTWTLSFADDATSGTFTGTFQGREVKGAFTLVRERSESFAVLRAGQSWGHHHADKGSLWFWGRNVHFFGDCSWGGPPGGTYWNPWKQGPHSGTQLEFEGINNWTLPCKYPAPWISDAEYGTGIDYAVARCLYPYNPPVDLTQSTSVALANGYDRQVLFVHPDLVVVRDHVETNCPVVWRMHAYQPTRAVGATATLTSSKNVSGDLAVVYPATGVEFEVLDAIPEVHPYRGKDNPYAGEKFGTTMLRWRVPAGVSPTWVFASRADSDGKLKTELLDPAGRVVKTILGDGTVVTSLMDAQEFTFVGEGWSFTGTAGVIVEREGKAEKRAIRGTFR